MQRLLHHTLQWQAWFRALKHIHIGMLAYPIMKKFDKQVYRILFCSSLSWVLGPLQKRRFTQTCSGQSQDTAVNQAGNLRLVYYAWFSLTIMLPAGHCCLCPPIWLIVIIWCKKFSLWPFLSFPRLCQIRGSHKKIHAPMAETKRSNSISCRHLGLFPAQDGQHSFANIVEPGEPNAGHHLTE